MRSIRFAALSLVAVVLACTATTAGPAGGGDPAADAGDDTISTKGMELVKGLPITDIALFQGPKSPLVAAGAKASGRAKPIVGRPGLLRVYVAPEADWTPREVVATLTLEGGAGKRVFSAQLAPAAASTDAKLDSTFNFEIPADVIAADTAFNVTLKTEPGQTSAGGADAAQWPVDGSLDPLAAKTTGDALQVMIVPIQYKADGSNRLPDTSDEQLERYRAGFMKLYPAHKVEVTVRSAPFPFSTAIQRTGAGFGEVLNAIIRLRQTDGAPKGTYYYGAFAPGSSFAAWCGGGCVAGLSPLAQNPGDTWTAASVGLGFTGENAVGTATHEVGHGHGRNHAPCQPGGGTINGVDTGYPKDSTYSGAKLGVWAFDIESKILVSPTANTDFMGYCNPTFISDYNYDALATRMAYVYGAAYEVRGPAQHLKLLAVDAEGRLSPAGDVTSAEPTFGDARTVRLSLADGSQASASGAYYAYDHLPGGLLVVPVGDAVVRSVEVRDLVPGIVSKLTLAN